MDSLINSHSFPHNHKHNQNAKSPKPEPDHRLLSRFAGSRPLEPEQLPCPRCNSINTKFCYYNNYNLSQPRHFCKSCRRYWTRGGTLRDVPIGGGTRKSVSSSSNKRPRTTTTTTTAAPSTITTTTNSATSSEDTQTIDPIASSDLGVDLNEAAVTTAVGKTAGSGLGCFWSSSGHIIGNNFIGGGIIPSNVYGLGYGLGLLEWPMEQMGGGGGGVHGGTTVVSGESLGCNTWQIGGGGGVADQGMLADGDYFTWPELAISTPAKAMK